MSNKPKEETHNYEALVHYQYNRLIPELRRIANMLENPVEHSFVEPAPHDDLVDVLNDGEAVEANLQFFEKSLDKLERNSYNRKR
jgi:hypothetical protein